MYQGISLQSAPPFGVVIGFFLNAQIYLIIAGILCGIVSLFGIDIDARSMEFIAITHSISIGFLLFVMFGALSQMLPVLAGIRLSYPKTIATISILCLNIGLLLLIYGFFQKDFFAISGILLMIGIFSVIINILLKPIKHWNPTIVYIYIAIISLCILGLCGIAMFGVYIGLWSIERYNLVFISHIVFGGFGWIMLLIMGVCLQVLPMFYIAPPFKKWQYKIALPFLFLCVLCGSMVNPTFAFLFGGIVAILFGICGIIVLKNRKRKMKDISISVWFFAFSNLVICGLAWIAYIIVDVDSLRYVGIMAFVFGFVFGVIFAMIYKIVPFLSWFHLSFEGVMGIPNMRDFITTKWHKIGIYAYGFIYIGAMMSVFAMIGYIVLSLGLVGCGIITFINIAKSYLQYKHISKTAPKINF